MAHDPSTVAVSLGRGDRVPGSPMDVPPVLSSTFVAGGQYVYGRDANPTWEPFEEVVGALEGGTAVAFASGLAAISAVIESLPAGATVVLPAGAYTGTRRLLADLQTRGRATARLVDITDTATTLDATDGAALLWLESPSNPLLEIADVEALAAGARERGALVAMDNTFSTPLLQRPLDKGVHYSVHSATKLLSGHSDVVMGVAVARDEALVQSLRSRRSLHGAIPGPVETFLALRGLRTLPVRLERAQATAAELAGRLGGHPEVEKVRYPGFATVVSFDVAGGAPAADAVCAAVRLIVPATSLGGVETMVERRGKVAGEEHLPPGLIRMSVGLEHVDDLWADLEQALGA
jgi:cystathionine gamma-synthase